VPRYQPADSQETPRFSGIRTFSRLPHTTDLAGVDVAIVGVPWDDATTYRTGTRFGPAGVREMSAMLRTYNPSLDVNVYDHLSVVDYGDVPTVPGYIEDTYEAITHGIREILEAGTTPIAIGGDHSIALAELRAVAGKFGPVGFIQFDSHGDTWDSYFGHKYNHGTPFRRAAEEGLIDTGRAIQVGLRGSLYGPEDLDQSRDLGFEVLTADDVRRLGIASTAERIAQRAGRGPVFLSFDIDFIDPSFAPGTGTPEVGGFSTAEALAFVRSLRGVNLVGCDVVEVSPPYDSPGAVTALAAATVMYELLSLVALARR